MILFNNLNTLKEINNIVYKYKYGFPRFLLQRIYIHINKISLVIYLFVTTI